MIDLLQKGLKFSHLRFVSALAQENQLSAAAHKIGISQPAASRLAAEIDAIIGTKPFRRVGRGIELTPTGQALADRANRVLREMEDAAQEITEIRTGNAGNVSVGAVTAPAIEHVLPLIKDARATLPNISIDVEVNNSDQLAKMVASGQLDFAMARMPSDSTAADFDYYALGAEPLRLIVRPDHHLLSEKRIIPCSELLDYDWVMPRPGQILRNTVERTLRDSGLPSPARTVNTTSFLLILATIGQTDAIAPISMAVADEFEAHGLVRQLSIDISFTVEPFGIITRRDALLTPAAEVVRKLLVQSASR